MASGNSHHHPARRENDRVRLLSSPQRQKLTLSYIDAYWCQLTVQTGFQPKLHGQCLSEAILLHDVGLSSAALPKLK